LPTVTYAEAIKALLGGFASNGRLMVAARIGAYILAAFVFMACAVWYARPDGSTIRIPTVADLGNAMSRHDDVELSEFLLLDNGISYREACSIIGFDGTEISRVAIPGMGAMVMYSCVAQCVAYSQYRPYCVPVPCAVSYPSSGAPGPFGEPPYQASPLPTAPDLSGLP
jgi:hypothetical protein